MPQSRILITHVKSDRLSRPFVFSAVGHAVLFLGATFVTDLFPPVEIVSGSTGAGGGQGGNLVSVGLAADLGGGAGMYKPAVTPRVQAAPPPRTKRKQEVTPKPAPDQIEFQQKTSRKRRSRPKKKAPVPSRAGSKDSQSDARAQVPRKADAGSGGTGGAPSGSGGGFGGGQGVRVGSGTGQEGLHSWYARQVEQRVGQNWLRASLGGLARPVETVVSFEVLRNGRIHRINLEQASGVRAVDLAAQRAIRASSPLPALPPELRNRRVRFVTYFQYPPR